MSTADEMPYIQYEPLLGTFEYGVAQNIFGCPLKKKLGFATSMGAAYQKLVEYGVDFSRYDKVVTGTRKAKKAAE